MILCIYCGSCNHQSYDCADQGQIYQPALQELSDLDPKVEPTPKPKPESVFESGPPRFKNCPAICTATNLPSFPDRAALVAFQERIASRSLKEWKCERCGGWHYVGKPRAPAGQSSGTERTPYYNPPGWVPFQRPKLRPSAFLQATHDLPRQEQKPELKPEKKLEAPKPKRQHVRREGMLF